MSIQDQCNQDMAQHQQDLAAELAKVMAERDAARAEAQHFRDELAKHCLDEACCDGSSDLPRVTAERDGLAALVAKAEAWLIAHDMVNNGANYGIECEAKANFRAALAAGKGENNKEQP